MSKNEPIENEPIDFEQIIEGLKSEIADLNESLLRERADAMNVRKRAEHDKMKLAGFYKSLVVKELLPAIDSLERAAASADDDSKEEDLKKGLSAVFKQFAGGMQKLGVERIETVGAAFDPELHEAVTMEEGDGEEIVSEELQSGYKVGDQIVRHAMVRVKS